MEFGLASQERKGERNKDKIMPDLLNVCGGL